jgi:predicted PurR-regulated permease PerM
MPDEDSAARVVTLPRTDPEPAATAPTALPDDTLAPAAPDLRTVFQGGTFILLLLAACYGAAEIVLPIVVAFVLMLVLQPAMRFLQRWHVPRGLAAAALIILLFGALGGLGTALSGPAAS